MTSLHKVLKNDEFVLSEKVIEISDYELDNIKNEAEEPSAEEEKPELDEKAKAELMEQAMLQIEKERQKILNQTQIECDHLKQIAYDEGYNDAFQSKKDEIENCILGASNTLNQLKLQIENFMNEYEANLHELATEIASKLLAKKIDKDDSEMLSLVKHGVDTVKNTDWISVTISDEAEKLYSALISEFNSHNDKNVQISVKSLPKDSCLIETPNGMLDISISEQLNNLKALFS